MKQISLIVLILSYVSHAQSPNFDWAIETQTNTVLSMCADPFGNVFTTGISTIEINKMDPNGNLIWSKSMLNGNWNDAYDITNDNDGNVIIVGEFMDTLDFDPGPGVFNMIAVPGVNSHYDGFIEKLDSAGNFLWAISYGGTGYEQPVSVETDETGNIYMLGWYLDTTDLDPGAGVIEAVSISGYDFSISKFDPNGNFLWAKSFSSAITMNANSLILDDENNLLITGTFMDTVDFDPGPGTEILTASDFSSFILKLDNSGNFIWVKNIVNGSSEGWTVATYNNEVYVSGQYEQTCDFDPSSGTQNFTAIGSWDCFVLKLDKNGNFIWVKTFGSNSSDSIWDMDLSETGNVYCVGTFIDTMDIDPGPGNTIFTVNNYSWDAFQLALDPNGDFMWANSYGGPNLDRASNIVVNNDWDIFTGGQYNTLIDLDPGTSSVILTTGGGSSGFVQKMSQCIFDTGIIQNVDVFSSNISNAAYQWIDCDLNTPIVGETNQSYALTSNGNYAVIATKNGCTDTSQCKSIGDLSTKLITDQPFNVYPIPFQNQITIESNGFTQVQIFDVAGKIIMSYKISSSTETINTEMVLPGTYLMILSDGEKVSRKIIIK